MRRGILLLLPSHQSAGRYEWPDKSAGHDECIYYICWRFHQLRNFNCTIIQSCMLLYLLTINFNWLTSQEITRQVSMSPCSLQHNSRFGWRWSQGNRFLLRWVRRGNPRWRCGVWWGPGQRCGAPYKPATRGASGGSATHGAGRGPDWQGERRRGTAPASDMGGCLIYISYQKTTHCEP